MATRTSALWRKQQSEQEAGFTELTRVVSEEFPVGTRVRWTHRALGEAPSRREGVVCAVNLSDLYVQLKPDGYKHRVPAWQAEILSK